MLTQQNKREKSETLTNHAIPYLMHQSQIHKKTPDDAPTSNLTKFIPKYVIKFEQQNKNDKDKHNPHTRTNIPPHNNKHIPHTVTNTTPTQ